MAISRFIHSLPQAIKRPESSLATPEIQCLELYLFTHIQIHDIYKMVFPCTGVPDSTIKTQARRLLESNDAQVYLQDRSTQLETALRGGNSAEELDVSEYLDEDGNFRPAVMRKVKARIAKEVMTGDTDKNRYLEQMSQFIFKQTNVKDADKPLRVLAEQCGTCVYRVHCEENYENLCKYCRYQAESNNFYDHKTQFDFPETITHQKIEENGD